MIRLTLIMLLYALPTFAQRPLVAEISSHDITIHSAFDGTELILFGVRNDPGDIVVVVRGPASQATIRRKEKVAGIWVNRTTHTFEDVPAFYALASSQPYESIPKSVYFEALQIGYMQALQPFHLAHTTPQQSDSEKPLFSRAMLRLLRQNAVYGTNTLPITFIGGGLFKTTIPFPDNTPTGTYSVEVYLVSDGQIDGMHVTPIFVYKSGMDAFIYSLAHEHPVIYGIIAIMLGLGGGAGAVHLFRKRRGN